MKKFFAILLVIAGIILAVVAYARYSAFEFSKLSAEWQRKHPERPVWPGKSSEEYIAGHLAMADAERNWTILAGAGAVICLGGGVWLFIRARREQQLIASLQPKPPEEPPPPLELMTRWATAELTQPVQVEYKSFYSVVPIVMALLFFIFSASLITTRPFTGAQILLLMFNGAVFFLFFYFQLKGRNRSARVFDLSGVTRGDNRRLSWSQFKGVVCLMARLRNSSAEEYIWRVELRFSDGAAWIIPQRLKNRGEIMRLVGSLPGAPQKKSV